MLRLSLSLALVGLSISGQLKQGRASDAPMSSLEDIKILALGGQTQNNQSLQDCLGASNIPVRFSFSSDFDDLKRPYNLRITYNPAVIVLPSTSQHVSGAVKCAGQSKVRVQAKSGGHSYGSFSSGGQDGSMIIDLQNFQQIVVNDTGVASIGAGVRLGNLATGIYNKTKRALPHGTCPGVGVGGHATHGGFGYSSRAWGLTLDTIVGMDAVLANGAQIHVDKDSFPDLWYALRGDAADIGIITTFYFQTLPAPDSVVNWSFDLPKMFTNASTTASAFDHIQSFALNASFTDRNLGLGIFLDGTVFTVSGTYFGSLDTFNKKLVPALLSKLPEPTKKDVKSLSWLDSLKALDNNAPLEQPLTTYSAHDDFFAKSVVTPSSKPLTVGALTSYFNYINAHGINNSSVGTWYAIFNLYGGPDSQINAVPASSAAYSDRAALWVVQHYGFTANTDSPYPQGNIDFIEGLNKALTEVMEKDGVKFGAYANYVDPSLSAQQAHVLYYGQETYAKLLDIKKSVDPGSVFWNPQSVGN